MSCNVRAGIQYLSQVRGTSLADFIVLVCARARLLHSGVYASKGDQLFCLFEPRKITYFRQNDNSSILADSRDTCERLHLAPKGSVTLRYFKNLISICPAARCTCISISTNNVMSVLKEPRSTRICMASAATFSKQSVFFTT